MPVLDCSVKTCCYNENNKCCLEGIKVEGKQADTSDATACGSFKLRMDGAMTNACCTKKPTDTSTVDCAAVKCTFNQAQKCTAKHIGIAGSKADRSEATECASFVMQEQ